MSGRNDPCQCGSGKKTKKCCGAVAAQRTYRVASEAEGIKKVSMPMFQKVFSQKQEGSFEKN